MLAQLRLSPRWQAGEEFLQSFFSFLCLDFVSPPVRSAVAYAFRTWIAGILALYIAFFCQLESPYWAPIATWISSLPIPGMTISKGMYRILGSIVGALMGLVLIALFAQTPNLFILALALWVGACTLCANLMTNFRAYASVLAGYTTAIVALPTVPHPNQIFDVAMARGSCTIIGIICAVVVTRLFAPHKAREQVLHKLKALIGDTARRAAFPLAGIPVEDIYAIAYKLLADLISLDTEIEYAAAESATFRIHANRARDQVSELFEVISGARAIRTMEDEGGKIVLTDALNSLREDAVHVLTDVPQAVAKDEIPQSLAGLRDLRSRIAAQHPEESNDPIPSVIRQRLFLDHLDDLLRHMENALLDSMALDGPWQDDPPHQLNFHRDHRLAWINALRAFVAVIAAGAFWIATAWSSGASMIIFVAVVCSLFSSLPRPDMAGSLFFWGTLAASIVAFPFVYVILQKVDGQFVLLALALGLVMIPGAAMSALPKTNLFGFAFTVNFLAAVAPLNPMSYNVITFLNNTIALNIGVAFGSLAYLLILPPDLLAADRYVRYRIRRGFEILAQREPMPPPATWKSRMFDRVNRLYVAAEAVGVERNVWMERGLRALHFGNGVLRLRLLLATGKLKQETAVMIQSILDAIGWFTERPRVACEFVKSGVEHMQRSTAPEEPEAKIAFVRTLGTLQEMDEFFARHPIYLEAK
jgi:uncharacterized membrane protein YccC